MTPPVGKVLGSPLWQKKYVVPSGKLASWTANWPLLFDAETFGAM
jgi:hypothetical protein